MRPQCNFGFFARWDLRPPATDCNSMSSPQPPHPLLYYFDKHSLDCHSNQSSPIPPSIATSAYHRHLGPEAPPVPISNTASPHDQYRRRPKRYRPWSTRPQKHPLRWSKSRHQTFRRPNHIPILAPPRLHLSHSSNSPQWVHSKFSKHPNPPIYLHREWPDVAHR